ncbi:ferredoxin-NADP reductase [Bradyrhizobium sp. USDA 4501]
MDTPKMLATSVPEIPVIEPSAANGLLDVTVVRREEPGEGIVIIDLAAVDGEPLPRFEAGAHVDVHIGPKLVRQYSLCGDPADTSTYRLGIKLEDKSRGGSAGIHREVKVGHRLAISQPRNNFPLAGKAVRSVLIAGGIGVTPMLAMAAHLQRQGADFEFHYCARSLGAAAFSSEIERSSYAQRVRLHLDDGDEEQKFAIQRDIPPAAAGAHLYVCGPAPFIDLVLEEAQRKGWPQNQLHHERFTAAVVHGGDRFEVAAARSGVTVTVLSDQSIASALHAAGVEVPLSCEQGVCGTCLVGVIEGLPEHRDVYQTESELAANDRIAVCCSRARSARLVLDI